ncbi:Uncharacterised protein [Chryseobacterium gleum]|uniref:Uncharacterized protein n=2 Tax=Chryseobacterium gleum TaxID=250 RepID=A0A3S4QZQ8_CHRGE|nr:hypothetical protein HMPREF0204_15281 [Chryseobacterium gleum ATCC 35910]QBJ88223.1 hypothetical protein DDI74_19155 [Chryseobacterium gleum]VEE10915.1 Uncharacterised protein [Chryseobacterium gleum]
MKLLNNILKLIVIMYFGILAKNILQLTLGYLSNSENDIKLYKLYNLQESNYSYDFLLQLIFIYDFLFLAVIFYLPLYLILYLIVARFGNKVWLQIFYLITIYLLIIYFLGQSNFNYLFIIITTLIGLLNWFLFKKWIKIT